MARRLLLVPLLVLTLVAGGVRGVEAQQPAARLSQVAQSLRAYLPSQADLPVGARFTGAAEEATNEDVVASDPDQAALVRKHGRITGIEQAAERDNPQADLSFQLGLFKDAAGAWGDALDSTFPAGLDVETTEPGPEVGERSVLFHTTAGLTSDRVEIFSLVFQRDRLEVGLTVAGAPGTVSADTLLPIARAIDAHIRAAPPGPVSAAELALIEEPTPAVLVRGAVRLLLRDYVEPLDAAELLTEAWQGAARAMTAAGVQDVPPPPTYPANEDEAIALHMRMFPTLEKLADGRLTSKQLAYAAIMELVNRRDDCHTAFLTAEELAAEKATDAGTSMVLLGLAFAPDTPLRVIYVFPSSPAKMAGLRRGQVVLAINGTSVAGRSVTEARALIDRREGAPNTFQVRNPSGRIEEIMVAPAPYSVPALESEVLPGNIGLIRFYEFRPGAAQVRMLREALERFEAQGVQGWIIDLRENPGGYEQTMVAMISLFVQDGRLFGTVARGEPPEYTDATGAVLPFQRPLAFLVGPDSASAAEIMAGVLQARGRAVVVGEQSAGCVGSTRAGNGLLDGSALNVTRTEIVIGPNDLHYNRVGLTPDVMAPAPTINDDEAGYDPQLTAAITAVLQR